MSRGVFGWDLPPGCSQNDIDRACGADRPEPETCAVCGCDLDEEWDAGHTAFCQEDLPACAKHDDFEWRPETESDPAGWWPPDQESAKRSRCLCVECVKIIPFEALDERCSGCRAKEE